MPSRRHALVVVPLAAPTLAACGDHGDHGDGCATPSDQLRDAAIEAGSSDAVADAFALAARADAATSQITYAGADGARLVVSQDPPRRRVDVTRGDGVVSSRLLLDGIGDRCEADTAEGAEPTTPEAGTELDGSGSGPAPTC